MSVYTTIEANELQDFLKNYTLGDLVSHAGISAGIENTNYFVTTTKGEYVLTIFEGLSADELPYFLDLMAFLAEHEVPSAHPLADNEGHYLRTLKDKPAALVCRLKGSWVKSPNLKQIEALGDAVGHMHAASTQFTGHRENGRGPHWWQETAKKLHGKLSKEDNQLLQEELRFQSLYRHSDLPRGVTHADLFRDNALWTDNTLTGIIDFYYACNDVLLYDMAVTINDWCTREDSTLDEDKVLGFLQHYHAQRPVTAIEKGAWPVMLRAAALRFWLSRLNDLHFPRPGELTHIKDPDVIKRILLDRINNHDRLHNLWINQ